MKLEPGAQVDRYTLVSLLGEGGQAQVWKAVDPLAAGKTFAIKLLWLDAAGPEDIERARREAHHLARLDHPSLPACHALFEDLRRNLLGLVLDLVEGTPLDRAIADPRFSPDMALPIARRLAEGLAYLHAEGLVHRDVKPDNVLLSERFWQNPGDPGAVKLIDLGISVTRGNPRPLTAIGRLIGTPPFMPPEQIDPAFWRAPEDTPAADVFALGVVVWWVLHRAHPAGADLHEPLPVFARAYRAVAQQHTPWPPESPAPWGPFFQKSLALARDQRAATASELLPLLGAPAPGVAVAPPRSTPPLPPLATGPAQAITGPAQAITGLTEATGPTQPLAGPSPGPLPPPVPTTGVPSSVPRTLDDQVPASTLLDATAIDAPALVAERPPPGPLPAALQPATPPELAAPPPSQPPPSSAPTPPGQQRRVLLLGVLIGTLVTLVLVWLTRPATRRKLRRQERQP